MRAETFHIIDQKRKVRSLRLEPKTGSQACHPGYPNHRKTESSPGVAPTPTIAAGNICRKRKSWRSLPQPPCRGRHGRRDSALILIAYLHGLRVSELVSLRWDQIDLAQGLVHVARLKNGMASVHPLRGPELRALRRLQREDASAAYVVRE